MSLDKLLDAAAGILLVAVVVVVSFTFGWGIGSLIARLL